MPPINYLVIGSGIIGSAIARQLVLSENAKVTVLEKEKYYGMHASRRNSGVIHSGINQKPGSDKARMAIKGNKQAREFCQEHSVPLEEVGTLVVARNRSEVKNLEDLRDNGVKSGVAGLKIIDKIALKEREPSVVGYRALFSPNGAIVDSLKFLHKVIKDGKDSGVSYVTGAEVKEIHGTTLVTTRGNFEADHIINCAGLQADEIAHMMGVGLGYQIIPFKGEYKEVDNLDLRSMVYPVHNPRYPFLGVHLTKTTDGKVLAGPTASLAFGREAYDKKFDFKEFMKLISNPVFLKLFVRNNGLIKETMYNLRLSLSPSFFAEQVKKISPSVRNEDLHEHDPGIRATLVASSGKLVDDFLVEYLPNSTHVLNAVSPGMTASLAFAEEVVKNMKRKREKK